MLKREPVNLRGSGGRSTALELQVAETLNTLKVEPSFIFVIGVSGGADSMALLSAIQRWTALAGRGGRVIVAHLNHQLRGEESDLDEALVREVAAQFELAFELERVDVAAIARERRLNLEATARDCRYNFLSRVAGRWQRTIGSNIGCLVCTGHTADDQAETFLMRMIRGSGTTGLSGIHLQRYLKEGVRLIRPLLHVKRATVIEHCHQRQVPFRIDQSNLTKDFLRNRVRHDLIAVLQAYNPAVSDLLVRAAGLLRDDDDFLQSLAHERRREATTEGGLDAGKLLALPAALRRRVLRDWVAEQPDGARALSAVHLGSIEQLLGDGRSGRSAQLPGGVAVVRVFDEIQFQRKSGPPPVEIALLPDQCIHFGRFRLMLNYGSCPPPPLTVPGAYLAAIRSVAATGGLRVRARRVGDTISVAGTCHRIKLKKLMIRHKIPAWKRDTWPIIVGGPEDNLIWVPGVGVDAGQATVVDSAETEAQRPNLHQLGDNSLFWLQVVENLK